MKKSLLLTLLALLLALTFVLCACDKTPDPPPADSESDSLPAESDTTPETDVEQSNDITTHKIIENGVANYSIIRAESTSKDVSKSITKLHTFLWDRSSEYVKLDSDYSLEYVTTGTHDENSFEIVIGNTNYEKSAELISSLGFGEYVIEASGNKIYIVSPMDTGISAAIEYLLSLFEKAYDSASKELTLTSEEIKSHTVYNKALADVPLIENGKYEFFKDGGDGSIMLVFSGTKPEDYSNYVTKLTEVGYKEYSRNDSFGDNKFVLVTKDESAVNVLYTKADSSTRIIIDDLTCTSLPEIDSDYTSAQKVCDSLVIQIGVSPGDGTAHNGQCYVFRCEDGRFIIIDGGFVNNNSGGNIPRNNAQRLYDTLVAYTPSNMKTTVACWIFTHEHDDHTGAFNAFVKKYADKIELDQVLFNYPLNDIDDKPWPERDNLRNLVNTYFKDAEIVKPHPGQTFKYANIDMEILYTVELLWPAKLTSTLNNSSIVNRFYIGEQSILTPGDMGPNANPVCIKYNGSYLKSDFYQVTHHGYSGGSNAFNKLVAPTWVLWPVGEGRYAENKASDRNSWLSDPTSSVKQIFPALFNTTVIHFPFDGTNYTVTENK